MASALGSFTSGLMAGQEHADKRRRNKAIDELLDRNAYEKDLGVAAQKEEWIAGGQDPAEFPEFDNPASQDPYLVRGFNWLKNKFGWGGEDDVAQVVPQLTDEDTEPQSGRALPAGQFYADGGTVKRRGGSRAAGIPIEEQDLDPNKRRAPNNKPSTLGGEYIAGAFDDTTRTWDMADDAMQGRVQDIKDADGAAATGGAIRDWMVEGTKGTLATAAAVGKDVFVDNPLVQGVLGFVGFDGKRDNRQPDPNTPPAQAAAAPEEAAPKKAAIAEAVGDEKPTDQIAADAVQKGVEMTPGHPDNPDQAFDWAEVSASGVRPEDIPNMPVKDWEEYRRRAGRAAALRGETWASAQEEVTKMQIQGAQSNMMQAAFLLRSGDPRGAALAARAAFQYFPNGTDVRFGIYDSPEGPVLVGMGTDEETGEPVGKGKPMMLTPDTITAMAANFSDPKAFSTWTLDWRKLEEEVRTREEIDKPKAQADINLKGAQEDYYRSGAEKNLADAEYARTGKGGAGGPKQSDYRESFATQAEILFSSEVGDEDLIAMNDVANAIRQRHPDQSQLSDSQIVGMVLRYYESGDETELTRYLGATE